MLLGCWDVELLRLVQAEPDDRVWRHIVLRCVSTELGLGRLRLGSHAVIVMEADRRVLEAVRELSVPGPLLMLVRSYVAWAAQVEFIRRSPTHAWTHRAHLLTFGLVKANRHSALRVVGVQHGVQRHLRYLLIFEVCGWEASLHHRLLSTLNLNVNRIGIGFLGHRWKTGRVDRQ